MGKNWFRGHSKCYNQLTPGIFRNQYNSPIHEMFKPHHESEIVYQFKRYAPSIISNVPGEFDFLTWLFWIQHYGMPTRLLDWTENILVATFFCVVNDHNEDGEIWTIYPDNLNQQSGFNGLAMTNNRKVKFLSGEPFHTNPQKLLKELELNEVPLYPIAFSPPKIFMRISAQHGTFTILLDIFEKRWRKPILCLQQHNNRCFRHTYANLARYTIVTG